MSNNPLDWGNSPIVTGGLRAAGTALVAGASAYVGAQLIGEPETMARLLGEAAALAVLAPMFGLAGYDQFRANNGIVSSSDVPVAALAQVDGTSPSAVARVVEANIKAGPDAQEDPRP